MHDSRKSLYLGMVVGVLMSGIVGLAAFLYFDGPALIDSAFASDRRGGGGDLCDRVEAFDDFELVHAMGWFANEKRPHGADVVMMGRKTRLEICERADAMLRRDLPPADYDRVASCVGAASTTAAARACFQ